MTADHADLPRPEPLTPAQRWEAVRRLVASGLLPPERLWAEGLAYQPAAAPAATPSVPDPPAAPTAATPKAKPRVTAAEANVLVRDWLARHARANPAAVKRDAIAAAIGVSKGLVSKTAAWKAFAAERKQQTPAAERTVPLKDEMLAVMPDDRTGGSTVLDAIGNAEDARLREIAKLEAEQRADQAADDREERRPARRHSYRHGPS